MTSCKEISVEKEEKKTKFQVEIDITDCKQFRKGMVKYLKNAYNEEAGCSWMSQLAEIIERG